MRSIAKYDVLKTAEYYVNVEDDDSTSGHLISTSSIATGGSGVVMTIFVGTKRKCHWCRKRWWSQKLVVARSWA